MAPPRKKRPEEKGPVGRPVGWRKEVNIELLKRMAARHCTLEEMADCLGCHTVTLRANYYDIIQEAKAEGKLSLRDHQWKILEKGSADMAKWLGRAILKQNEQVDLTDSEQSKILEYAEAIREARRREQALEAQGAPIEGQQAPSSGTGTQASAAGLQTSL